ncbi:MAG: hypothetical protein IKN91_01035 [Paludibacteraceae bacterium]|nr:hypothetical protein [Paludibacteraceae bacterium]
MKKFISLLCALLIIVGANAVPRKAGKANINPQQKEQFIKAHKSHAKKPFAKQLNTTTQHKGKVADFVQVSKARKAKAETNVEIVSYAGTFYPEDNSVFYGLHNENYTMSFFFSIFLPEGSRDVELGKTYTLADMDSAYSELDEWDSNIDDFVYHYYKSVTFVKTVGENYDVTIEARVVDVDDNIYNLKYKEDPVIITGDTIEVAIKNPMSNVDRISDGTWRLLGSDSAYQAQLNYFSDDENSPAGVFSGNELEYGSIYIYVYGDELDDYGDPVYTTIHAKDGSISVSEVDIVIAAVAYILGDDGNVYHITMTYTKPHAETYETITADNLVMNDWSFDWFGEVEFSASDDNNSIRFFIQPDSLGEGLNGTYEVALNGCNGYVMPIGAEDSYQLHSGSIEIKYDNGSIFATGKVLALNNVEYTLDLKYIKPIYNPTRQEELTFEGIELLDAGLAWQVRGYSADTTKFISLAAYYDEEMSGDFAIESILQGNYSFVVTDIVIEDDSVTAFKQFTIVDANINLAYDEETKTATITGTLICVNDSDETDIPEFTISIVATAPDPYAYDNAEADFIVDFAKFGIDTTYLTEEQLIYVVAEEGNKAIGLEFNLSSLDELVPGEYPFAFGYEPNTVSASQGLTSGGIVTYSFAGETNAQGQISSVWFIVSGTVTLDENKVFTVDALNSNGKAIRCRLGDKSALQTIEGSKAEFVKRLINGRLIIERDGVQYNANGARVK